MAGSATVHSQYSGRLRTITWEWTSDASGDVNGVGIIYVPSGSVHAFASDPASGVSDLFDVVVLGSYVLPNGNSVSFADLLDGEGANLSNSTNGQWVNLSNPFPIPVSETGLKLEPQISNAGNAQSGKFMLHIWKEQDT